MSRRAPRGSCESEEALARHLRRAADTFPTSDSDERIRGEFLAKVHAARERSATAERSLGPRPRSRLLPAFASVCIVAVAVAFLFLSVGLATVNAMPGNPFYSLKRSVERGRLAVSSSGGKVDALLSQANERMVELEFARAHKMGGWLLPLAEDAREEIDEAKREAGRIGRSVSAETLEKAGRIVTDHEAALRESVRKLPPQERGMAEQWIDEEVDGVEMVEPQRDDADEDQGIHEEDKTPTKEVVEPLEHEEVSPERVTPEEDEGEGDPDESRRPEVPAAAQDEPHERDEALQVPAGHEVAGSQRGPRGRTAAGGKAAKKSHDREKDRSTVSSRLRIEEEGAGGSSLADGDAREVRGKAVRGEERTVGAASDDRPPAEALEDETHAAEADVKDPQNSEKAQEDPRDTNAGQAD